MLVNDKERRAFNRLPIDCDVIYKRPGASAVLIGKGKNLSASGILFMADRAITVGTEIEVNLMPSTRNLAPLNALVKVVRMAPSPSVSQFAIAGTIEKII